MDQNPSASRRRWLGWRNLLIAIALLAIPLGWLALQYDPIRERRAIERSILSQGRGEFFLGEMELGKKGVKPPPLLTGLRAWLGDQAMHHIVLDPNLVSTDEVAEVRRLFPEAVIDLVPKTQWYREPR
jgi:hypothetical protein